MEFTSVMNKAISHKSKVDSMKVQYNDNLARLGSLESELDNYNDQYKNLGLVYAYLEKLINNESEKFIREVESLLTIALKAIFTDKDYECVIKSDKESSASIHIRYYDDDGNEICPNIRKAVGGGIQTVIGFLLQVFFILQYDVERVIFVDEGFYAISEEYLGNFKDFVAELIRSEDFKIMLITHDKDRMLQFASKVYLIDDGKSSVVEGAGTVEY